MIFSIFLFACNSKNTPPNIKMISPDDGAAFAVGDMIRFEAEVSDAEQDANTLKVEWSSDRDGVLSTTSPSSNGELVFGSANLSEGNHAITLLVRDDQDAQAAELLLVKIGEGSDPDDTGAPDEPVDESDKNNTQGMCASGGQSSDGTFVHKSCLGPIKAASSQSMSDGTMIWTPKSQALRINP